MINQADSSVESTRENQAVNTRKSTRRDLRTFIAGVSPYSWSLLVIGILAFATRFIGLAQPSDSGYPVFDEKHYAPQSWQMVRSWDNIFVGGIEDNPAYGLIVHPPVGKQVEMISEWIFGYSPIGWRVMPALCSVAIVLLIMGIARRISGSTLVATIAGLIAVCDGVLLVSGRTALLDVFQCLFVTASAYFLVRDGQSMEQRFQKVHCEGRMDEYESGPRLGYRWWRFAAGVAIGLAIGVKWSGLFYIAFFGFYSVFSDLNRRRRYGVRKPILGTLKFDTIPALASLALLPIALYLFSWRAWFANENSVYRHAAEAGQIDSNSPFLWLPDSVASWLYYQQKVLQFHAELTNSNGHHHPWESKPWDWIVSWRPMLYYDSISRDGTHYAQMLFGTPIIWWIAPLIILWGLWKWLGRRDRSWAIPIVGYLAGLLPWFSDTDRQMYFFYATNMVPFLVVGIALWLGQLSGWSLKKPGATETPSPTMGTRLKTIWTEQTGFTLACMYVALVIAMFVYFLPLMVALPLSQSEWNAHMWLPSWQ